MFDYHWHLLLQILSPFSTSCTLDIMMMMILAPNNNHVLIQQLAIHATSNWRFIRKGLLFSPSAPFFSPPFSLSGFSLSSSRFGWNQQKREHSLFQMFDSEGRKVREKFTINKSFNDQDSESHPSNHRISKVYTSRDVLFWILNCERRKRKGIVKRGRKNFFQERKGERKEHKGRRKKKGRKEVGGVSCYVVFLLNNNKRNFIFLFLSFHSLSSNL